MLIAHDIRSTHNVGSLLRTADCLGVDTVYLTGYTPYPASLNDSRLPHIVRKLQKDISKTALGAEQTVDWQNEYDPASVISLLRDKNYTIVGLEQAATSVPLNTLEPPDKVALLIGREVEGIDEALLTACDVIAEIPQFGSKESLNVVQATAIALYHFRFTI
ncbi:MAG: rRNA (guanosine2251-2-O)-methyltransferase [Patescibacteria group bacterium]|nr:rRNA (guanosine2251-2-O)-methyltransferase [Patescibacteria group bacterium]